MDVDGDGRDELMVPNTRVPGYEYCGGEYRTILNDGSHAVFCGAEFDNPDIEVRFDHYDQSVFTWDAWKFIEQADGSYTVVVVPTNLKAPINNPGLQQQDWNGDGLTDLQFRLVNGPLQDGIYQSGYRFLPNGTNDLGHTRRKATPELLICSRPSVTDWERQQVGRTGLFPTILQRLTRRLAATCRQS